MLPMMHAPQGFTARRSAASNLPTFQLPPPDLANAMPRYSAYAPLAGLAGEICSPVASSINSGSSTGSSTNSGPTYQPMTLWSTPQNPNYNVFNSPPSPPPTAPPPLMQVPFLQQPHQQQQAFMGPPLYSPPNPNFPPNRAPSSPLHHGGLPHPPFDWSLPPFPTTMSISRGSAGHQTVRNPSSQQHPSHLQPQQHQQQQPQPQGTNSHQAPPLANPQGPPHAPQDYNGRPPSIPNYHAPSTNSLQSTFLAYTQAPTASSPIATTAPPNRMSPISSVLPPPHPFPRPYSYDLPAMPVPILSNLHNPGSQMSLIGGLNPYLPHHNPLTRQLYHHQTLRPTQAHTDRPFKCDQCQQSFNRNHDLKRHKRIHLAVKPFPCGFCDKSFSRKDALKRHILVKGCGRRERQGAASTTTSTTTSISPIEKDETSPVSPP